MYHLSLILIFFIFSSNTFARCESLLRITATLDTSKNKWVEAHRAKATQKICIDLSEPNANLELRFSKGKNSYVRRIFSPLYTYYDVAGPNKTLEGGVSPARYIAIRTWGPEWMSGSKLSITKIANRKLIFEVKL